MSNSIKQHHRSCHKHDMHHIHAPTPAPHSSFTQLLTTPSSCPSNPPPQTPQNPHLTQPLQHNETAQNRGTDAGKQGSSYQKHAAALPACGRGLVGSQSPPLVAPRGQKWHSSVACDTHTAQKSVRAHRNLGEGAGESRKQAAEAPDVAC